MKMISAGSPKEASPGRISNEMSFRDDGRVRSVTLYDPATLSRLEAEQGIEQDGLSRIRYFRLGDHYLATQWDREGQNRYQCMVLGERDLPDAVRQIFGAGYRPAVERLIASGSFDGFKSESAEEPSRQHPRGQQMCGLEYVLAPV